QIGLVINSFTTQMSDAKRLDIINKAATSMQKNYDDLQQFNSQNISVSIQRSKDENDINVVKQLYGLQ
ncbi:MAG: conjugal transfer protein TraI, partial [Bacteroidota bacterium]|nr:conjugal transfer protein TraI [Bacteroidota bacterium]